MAEHFEMFRHVGFFRFQWKKPFARIMEDPDGQTFALLCGINADKAVATFRNDVLELHLPKTEVSKAKHTSSNRGKRRLEGMPPCITYLVPLRPSTMTLEKVSCNYRVGRSHSGGNRGEEAEPG